MISKSSIGFTYKANGHTDIEAEDYDQAAEKAQERLEQLRDMRTINNSPGTEEITWYSDKG